VCTDFRVDPGQTRTFAVDNIPPPGGLARTIGFWKNWASCAASKGKQKPVLDQTLAAADPVGIAIGALTLHAGDCLKAVRLLDKSTVDTDKKMASDPALTFKLASRLLTFSRSRGPPRRPRRCRRRRPQPPSGGSPQEGRARS